MNTGEMKTIVSALSLAVAWMATASTADRVRGDFPENRSAWVHYAVPAMSNVQRLPDAYPEDGVPGGTNRIVMAKGEYEPCSILFYSFENLGKVQLELGEFQLVQDDKKSSVHLHLTPTPKSTPTPSSVIFPRANLDLKVVKCWYQNENAWYSYFGDTGNKLVPELLLNDEDLIRVDLKQEANYARLTAKDGTVKEKWLNAPPKTEGRFDTCDDRESFQSMRPEFADAATLKPIAFEKGVFKDVFLTAKTTKDTPAGLYRGEIKLYKMEENHRTPTPNTYISLGSVPVEIRVLDYELPQPKAYRNPERDFLVASYSYQHLGAICERNGNDIELAKRQFKATLKNMVEHNQTMYWLREDCDAEVDFAIQTMKEVGMRTDVFVGGVGSGGYLGSANDVNFYRRQAKARREYVDKKYGHHNFYLGFGDEPGAQWLMNERDKAYRAYGEQGFKFIMAGWDAIFEKGSFIYDWANIGTQPTVPGARASADRWNQIGDKYVAWYAGHHVGPENPDFNRRQNGLGAYLNGFSALCNYAHHFGPYNDRTTQYRAMVLCYGVYGGVLDTIAWEGFREGIDDIRYATLLTDLARKAEKHGDFDVRRRGKAALTYMAKIDPATCDQNAFRAEAQRWIGILRADLAAAPKPIPAFVEPTDEKEKKRYMGEIKLGENWPHRVATKPAGTVKSHGATNSFEHMAFTRLLNVKVDEIDGVWKELAKTYGAGVELKRIERTVGEAAVLANVRCDSERVRELEKIRESLFKPQPKKSYVVNYSAKPVYGPDAFDALGFKPEVQRLDRTFGGSTEFLYTDVSSGARAVAEKKAAERLPEPTMEAVTDDWGVHFRFVAPDPKAREVELGLAGAGSYEFYIAPGRGKPYMCMMAEDLNEKGGSIWNTMYTTIGHRRIETEDREYYTFKTTFRDDAIVLTVDFAWTAFAEDVPGNGGVWNFENMRWCRTGNYAWNGLNSIHGRSAWGDLKFEMPAEARARILRKQLFRARRIYQTAKGLCGTIGKWNDDLLGDVAFYETELKPLIAKYDAIADKLDAKTSDADILRLAKEVMPKWLCLEEVVGDMRARYLNARATATK